MMVDMPMKFKNLLLILLLFSYLQLNAITYRTQLFDNDIRTLKVLANSETLLPPVVNLNSDDVINISFDQLNYEFDYFNYKIIHCDASWQPSSLTTMDYLDGFDNGYIDEYDYSVSTTVNYINYSLQIPNDDVSLKISGNYAVLIARDNDFDNKLVAVACFSVAEYVSIFSSSITFNTIKELNKRYQQLDIEVNTNSVGSTQPMQDFKLIVRQNGRYDTEVEFDRPTYINGANLQYKNNVNLVFEAGNQFRSVDFSSIYTYGSGIDHIAYEKGLYNVYLEPSELRVRSPYNYPYDARGQYVINLQGSDNPEITADYMWVHFYMPLDAPFFTGSLYLVGEITSNLINEESRMVYDFEKKCYYKSLFLKQGGYNYIYALKNKGEDRLSLLETEGSFWQSKNRYELYLYYRPFGARYDRLVGFDTVE